MIDRLIYAVLFICCALAAAMAVGLAWLAWKGEVQTECPPGTQWKFSHFQTIIIGKGIHLIPINVCKKVELT